MRDIGYYKYVNNSDIVSPQNIGSNSVTKLDDVAFCNQNIIRAYYGFGSHGNTDCFYLCQSYSSVAKQLIRDNVNLLIRFSQDLLNLTHEYEAHINIEMSIQDFKMFFLEHKSPKISKEECLNYPINEYTIFIEMISMK